MAAARRVLIVTYTMAEPGAAVGVFFRALRLSREMCRRNWSCVICNYGPIPSDPKVDDARREVEIVQFDAGADCFSSALTLFRRIGPTVILFGEYPLPFMEPLLRACQALVAPPILLLEQYYNPDAGNRLNGVDYVLMYGVRSMWADTTVRHSTFRVVPPFIDRVTPRNELPLPDAATRHPTVTVVGFDRSVLSTGIQIAARIRQHGVVAVTLSHAPGVADRMLADAGIPPEGRRSLPLQSDATLFGLIAASRAVVLANGFMQIAEAVALACPAICIHRGLGMEGYQLDPAFQRVVMFPDGADDGARRVLEWLQESPFTREQRDALARERGGASLAADFIEHVVVRPRLGARLQRQTIRWHERLSTLVRRGRQEAIQ
jgi:hypothetical protein